MRTISIPLITVLVVAVLGVGASGVARAQDGSDLWLRYDPIADEAARSAYRRAISAIVVPSDTPTGRIVKDELQRGLRGLLGAEVPVTGAVTGAGAVIAGTPGTSPLVSALGWTEALELAGDEGYLIRSATVGGHAATVIASRGEAGALYGAFHFLRLIQTKQPLRGLDIAERPRLSLRLLNHWDNLDGTIERGYAGASLWNWADLPERPDPRITEYARANASIGINGAALNNVNARPESLSPAYLSKAAAIAGVLRPYGIRVYLSANFAAPRTLGGLATADPLDPEVARWWRERADAIYRVIPDFGGFLVKANSEGQPGPQDYGRTHADGANVLADALAPHGGIVMWRAFVYSADVDPDRVKRAYLEFVPLDGRFRDNVIVQVKNGPLDFQPREPFSPLFGSMPRTPLMAELQITQEYLGHSNHLVYLAPMWKEFLDADTYAAGPGSTVAKVIDGTLHGHRRTGMAGVANTGRDANWTGHLFGQANWYAYGRLAWNTGLTAEGIAEEWIAMTWGHAPAVTSTIRSLMLGSRETLVDYTMPLGLHHLIGGDHYAPMPENDDPRRADWSAIYYHRADGAGIGFDRTTRGSNAVGQYRSPLRERWNDPATCPENLLLWFHRLPWDHRLASGGTLWDGLVRHYRRGAEEAAGMVTAWESLRGKVDEPRFLAVLEKLHRQAADAAAWRDKNLRYFQQFSGRTW
ncbi:MAG TPA: alpha-glucuronidase family glycosyl hydrolase [Vicinamibacterales bacterium]|nr:alpha-glucuronidase family glycosyl hydrolase [Vicinamibacterales bacterium]